MTLSLGARGILGLTLVAAFLVGCGGSDNQPQDAAICGTGNQPGILTLKGLTPAKGAVVVNRGIVHSFTVVGAPADYYTFDLLHGERHTAGLSTPDSPRFKTVKSGANIDYQTTIDSWSNAPGHVVLDVRGTFTTSQGCTWAFPSPLFEYDVTPVAASDGGSAVDSAPSVDGPRVPGVDAADAPGILDVPSPIDVAAEVPTSVDAGSPIDGQTIAFDVSLAIDAR